jgi:hypothetical protein
MKNGATLIIMVLSGLLVVITVAMAWLAGNEFGAEDQLSHARTRLGELQQENKKAAVEFTTRDSELTRLRSQIQQLKSVKDAAQLADDEGRENLLIRITSAEARAKRAQNALEVVQGELKHAIEQSRIVEENLKARLDQAEKEKIEAEAKTQNGGDQEAADIAALKKQLNTTLQQLAAANSELVALRSVAVEKQESPLTAPPPIPAPASPLSSPPVRHPKINLVFGQIKAVEDKNQFVVVQLNTTKSVLAGGALAVTRQGIPVGILNVYRVGPQNVVFAALTPDLRGKVRVGDQVTLQK